MNKRRHDVCTAPIWLEVFKFTKVFDISSILGVISALADFHSACDQLYYHCDVI